MYIYCLYWHIADEHDAYYLVHKEKFTEEQLKEHYTIAYRESEDKLETAVINKMIELFGYEELQTEVDLNIGKLEDELENNY